MVDHGETCQLWKENFPKVNAPIILASLRAGKDLYTGVSFIFCPWCGAKLEPVKYALAPSLHAILERLTKTLKEFAELNDVTIQIYYRVSPQFIADVRAVKTALIDRNFVIGPFLYQLDDFLDQEAPTMLKRLEQQHPERFKLWHGLVNSYKELLIKLRELSQ